MEPRLTGKTCLVDVVLFFLVKRSSQATKRPLLMELPPPSPSVLPPCNSQNRFNKMDLKFSVLTRTETNSKEPPTGLPRAAPRMRGHQLEKETLHEGKEGPPAYISTDKLSMAQAVVSRFAILECSYDVYGARNTSAKLSGATHTHHLNEIRIDFLNSTQNNHEQTSR